MLLLSAAILVSAILTFRSTRHEKMYPISWAVPTAVAVALAQLVASPTGAAATATDFSSYEAKVSWYTWPMHGLLKAFESLSPSLGWIGSSPCLG